MSVLERVQEPPVSPATSKPAFPGRWLTFALGLTLLFVIGEVVLLSYAEAFVRESISQQQRLERLRGDIARLDEVLTMSAYMAAASGDAHWEARYRAQEPGLDRALAEAAEIVPAPRRGCTRPSPRTKRSWLSNGMRSV